MLREITSVEEMAALPSGTRVLNKFRLPEFVRKHYDRSWHSRYEGLFYPLG